MPRRGQVRVGVPRPVRHARPKTAKPVRPPAARRSFPPRSTNSPRAASRPRGSTTWRARAGIAKGTIYLYFRDKEDLFQELVRAMLTPLVGSIEAMGKADLPLSAMAGHFVDLFVREVYETRRKDVVRLMLAEGRRFPKLAEFYYREVLSRIIAAVRALLARAAARGEVPQGLVDFPQIIAAPGLLAIIWSDLFEKFEPLDVRAMMQTHVELLFAPRRPA